MVQFRSCSLFSACLRFPSPGGSDCTSHLQAVLATDPMRSLRKEMQLSGLWRRIAQARMGDFFRMGLGMMDRRVAFELTG